MVESTAKAVTTDILIVNLTQNTFWSDQPITGSVILKEGCPPANSLILIVKSLDTITLWRKHKRGNKRWLKNDEVSEELAHVELILDKFV
jgi:hypothetical protein